MGKDTDSPTCALARHAAELNLAELPARVVEQAKIVLIDTVAVLLAASQEASMKAALRTFPLAQGDCVVIGHGRGATPEQAAFVNGSGSHDIELDDYHPASRTHPAAVIVPAGLAAAQSMPGCPGSSLLAGIIAGYDVQARIAKAIGPQRQIERGFHATSTCGTIGAAVCAGRVLSLSAEQMSSCLALAISQSCGLLIYHNEPTHMHKSFQVATAARNGVYAALLAKAGYPGAPEVLSEQCNSLSPFGGPGPDFGQLTDGLGERYEITDTSLKRHSACGQTHSAIDAFLALREERGLEWEEIEAVEVQLAHDAVPTVDRRRLLTHNIQYVLAVVAREGRIGREHFTERWTGDPSIAQLAERIVVIGSDKMQSVFPSRWGAIVTVRTSRGSFAEECLVPRGSARCPFTAQELRAKFDGLARRQLDTDAASRLWEMAFDLDKFDSLAMFFQAIAAQPAVARAYSSDRSHDHRSS